MESFKKLALLNQSIMIIMAQYFIFFVGSPKLIKKYFSQFFKIFVLTIFLFSQFSCNSKIEKIKPVISSITESVYASGIVKSKQQYQAFSTVVGPIQTIYLKEGDIVKVGTPILSITHELQQLNKENAALSADYAGIASNQDKLNDAIQQVNFQKEKMNNDFLLLTRQQSLWQQNVGTKVELEQRELVYKASKTAYQSAILKLHDLKKQIQYSAAQTRKNYEISKRQANDFIIRSQIEGIIYKLYKEKGELANLQSPLALLGNDKQFMLEMQVDEYDIFKIKKGMLVLVTMDSYKGKVFQAKISDISPTMNEKSKTFLVEATFVNPPKTLYPFITFEGNIVLQTKAKALLIPRKLLLNDSTVINSDGKEILIKTGLKDYQMVEILGGLTSKDELINPTK
jgi:HlyD family secretion protein